MSKLAYFTKKTAAVSYWASHKDEHLFQMDKEGSKGSKQFIVGSLDNIWELLKSGKNYIYESWEDNPIHFSLDIDVPKEDSVTYDDVYMNVQQIITGVLLAVNNSDISSLLLDFKAFSISGFRLKYSDSFVISKRYFAKNDG